MTPHALLALELLGYGLGSGLIGVLIGRYAAPSVRAVAAAPGDELAGELNRMWEAGYDQGYQEGRHDGQDERSGTRARPDDLVPADAAGTPGQDIPEPRGDHSRAGRGGHEESTESEWDPRPTDLIARQARYHQPEPERPERPTTVADVMTWGAIRRAQIEEDLDAFRRHAQVWEEQWLPGYVGWLEDAKKASWTDRLIREGM